MLAADSFLVFRIENGGFFRIGTSHAICGDPYSEISSSLIDDVDTGETFAMFSTSVAPVKARCKL